MIEDLTRLRDTFSVREHTSEYNVGCRMFYEFRQLILFFFEAIIIVQGRKIKAQYLSL